ncbi:MAG: ADP-ribosylglycohydrolase family protein [Ignavibacteriales bacterium]|nr:MAG: ADP-ribosylglycohydrolase family protein [Ignavibacteriales bacterium]
MRISWLEISERIKYELQQLEEEGNNISELRSEWQQIEDAKNSVDEFRNKAKAFYQKIENIFSSNKNFENEPSSWNEIVRQCHIKTDTIPSFAHSFIEDRILGGWLGRSAGCLLGKPVEKTTRSGIRELLLSNGTWPISDYITERGIPNSLLQKYPWNKHNGKESLKENIVCMTEDDDMNYPMINLFVYERYGRNFTTENIIHTWMEMIPVLSTFTAERVAYLNTLNGILPPATATIRNPYREWIGAQIRADIWGWISPAQSAQASEFAWRDARLSHIGNGIYGEIFFASAIAASFKFNDLRKIINEALSFIPPRSKFYEAIHYVLSIPIHELSWDETVNSLYQKFGTYHWVHTINNAALVVAALLSSKGNYESAICNVVMGGWDTDSNGATVGSIMGTMLGAKNLPSKWIAPLKNKIRSSLKGFDNCLISDLAKRTVILSKYSD